ncbi:aldehyde dehydrogenase (NADP(+)) [Niabella terrae]
MLVDLAASETHLPEGRLSGELSRTIHQLQMFAGLLEEGSWVEAVIDRADASRQPQPKPDIRKMLQPLGPVIVFGASNFPFAFSTAGGDSASALAAGASIVIKAHPAHLKTSRAVFDLMSDAIRKTDLPSYTVQHLEGGFELGKALVQHPSTAAVGFTGSFSGGKALMGYAQQREVPIPVYAEMGSINPVVLYPEYLSLYPKQLAAKLAASVNLGAGQFCTNPGLMLAVAGPGLEEFTKNIASIFETTAAQPMLHSGICQNYEREILEIFSETGPELISQGPQQEGCGRPVIATITAADFLADNGLQREIFGPFALIVTARNTEELALVLKGLKGQLTTTLMATNRDLLQHETLVRLQQQLAGRIIVNEVPTGVEVCAGMVHGGPYPSSSSAQYSSVGTLAIKRWTRPVCYQGFPDFLLPDALKDSNPLRILRLVDNRWCHPAGAKPDSIPQP